LISSDLSLSAHIDGIVAKARQRANAILRCFVSRDPALLTRAYTVYVRPMLKHDCATWLPHLKPDIEKREGPRQYTKRLHRFEGLSYGKDCVSCALWLQWLYFDLYMCYRIIFGCVNIHVSEFFEFSRTDHTRGHPYKLCRRHSCNRVRSSYFVVRVINMWNSLPVDRVDFSSFVAFKRTVQQINFASFLSVSRLRLTGLLLMPLCGLLLHSHIVCIIYLLVIQCVRIK